MKILIESMTRVEHAGLVVRVWREEPSGHLTDREDLRRNVQRYLYEEPDPFALEDMARQILHLPYVNAVEILRNGEGVVAYKDWP